MHQSQPKNSARAEIRARNVQQFQQQFPTEEACKQYLATCRWPEGFASRAVDTGVCTPWRSAAGSVPNAGIRCRHLDEFVFRHNRRNQPMAAFQTLLGLGTGRTPTPYRRITGTRDMLKPLTEP